MIDYTLTNIPDQIRWLISSQELLGKKVSHDELARIARIQKSYFSKVMNRHALFSEDQLFLILDFFALKAEEKKFLELILAYERSSLASRQRELLKEIEIIQDQMLTPKEKLKATKQNVSAIGHSEYYLNPWHQIIHIGLTIPKYRKEPKLLGKHLNLEEDFFNKIFYFLLQEKLIEQSKEGVRILQDHVHLDRKSAIFRPWKQGLSLMSLDELRKNEKKEILGFNVVLTCSSKSLKKIKIKMLDVIKDLEQEVVDSKEEELVQLNLDLFKWIQQD
jgi:hypothetical protein